MDLRFSVKAVDWTVGIGGGRERNSNFLYKDETWAPVYRSPHHSLLCPDVKT